MIEELGTIFSKKLNKLLPLKAPNSQKKNAKLKKKENIFLRICEKNRLEVHSLTHR